MNSSSTNNNMQEQEDQVVEQKTSVSDYLDQPRTKKKENIILALGESLDPEIKIILHRSLKNRYKAHTIFTPQNPKDMLRSIGKKIAFMVVDDSFAEWSLLEPLILKIKESQYESGVPTYFLTDNSVGLIKHYHAGLFAYQEQDDYIEYMNMDKRELLIALDHIVKPDAKRRSRRYSIDIPVQYSSINLEQKMNGEVIDMSMHGALLKNDGALLFRPGDQLQVFFKITKILDSHEGEFMTLSGLVRRVGIAGNQAGVSWEYMSDKKIKQLSKLLNHYAQKDVLLKTKMHRRPAKPAS